LWHRYSLALLPASRCSRKENIMKWFYDLNIATKLVASFLVVLGLMLGWIMLSVLGPIYDTISKIRP